MLAQTICKSHLMCALGLVWVVLGCGDLQDKFISDQENRKPSATLVAKGRDFLVWAGVDAKFQSSALYALNLNTYANTLVQQGQSGDPLISVDSSIFKSQELYFFNRSSLHQDTNLLGFDSKKRRWGFAQVAGSSHGLIGDPHAVEVFKKQHIFLAHYNAGNVAYLNRKTGASRILLDSQDVSTWLNGEVLRPESLFLWHDANFENFKLFVLHQGIDRRFALNNTQRVFVLQFRNREWRQNFKTWKVTPESVTAIPIGASSGFGFFKGKANGLAVSKLWVVGMCSRAYAEKCHSRVEEIDVANLKSKTIWDLDAARVFYNGQIVQDRNSGIFYANCEISDGSGRYEPAVIGLDVEQKKIKTIHHFLRSGSGVAEGEFTGFWGLFVDEINRRLLVGDRRNLLQGKFWIYENEKYSKEINVDAIPYSGAILRTFISE